MARSKGKVGTKAYQNAMVQTEEYKMAEQAFLKRTENAEEMAEKMFQAILGIIEDLHKINHPNDQETGNATKS